MSRLRLSRPRASKVCVASIICWCDVHRARAPESISRCWSSLFPADRCCDSHVDPSGDAQCWDPAAGYTFELCCDAGSRMQATQVRQRWKALRLDYQGDLTRCLADLPEVQTGGFVGPSTVLINFNLDQFDSVREGVFPAGDEPAWYRTRRLEWRLGSLERPGRCRAPPETSRGVLQEAELSLDFYDRFRSAGVELNGWAVNLGAGFFEDPMHHLAKHRSVPAVFVDPLGLRDAPEPPSSVRFITAAAEPGNLCQIWAKGGLNCGPPGARSAPVDFLKIDVDSFDCALASAALRLSHPKVVWIEINLSVPPPLRFVRQWHPHWFDVWMHELDYGRVPATLGCSLSAVVALMREEGYGLYGFDRGDAVFVANEHGHVVGGVGIDEFQCYSEVDSHMYVNQYLVRDWLERRNPYDALRHVWCNLTMHDVLLGIGNMPFTLSL